MTLTTITSQGKTLQVSVLKKVLMIQGSKSKREAKLHATKASVWTLRKVNRQEVSLRKQPQAMMLKAYKTILGHKHSILRSSSLETTLSVSLKRNRKFDNRDKFKTQITRYHLEVILRKAPEVTWICKFKAVYIATCKGIIKVIWMFQLVMMPN